MPGAISDSSTLIHMALLERLDPLRQFYDEVLIPPAVWNEVVEQGHGRAGAREVEEAARSGWLKVEAPTNELLLRSLKRDLDDGEAEAISLAVQRDADVVLLDESHARRTADVYGVPKTGDRRSEMEDRGLRPAEKTEDGTVDPPVFRPRSSSPGDGRPDSGSSRFIQGSFSPPKMEMGDSRWKFGR